MATHEEPVIPEDMDAKLAEILSDDESQSSEIDPAYEDIRNQRAIILMALLAHGLVPPEIDTAKLSVDDDYEATLYFSDSTSVREFMYALNELMAVSFDKQTGIDPIAIAAILNLVEPSEESKWLVLLEELFGELPLAKNPDVRTEQLEMLMEINSEKNFHESVGRATVLSAREVLARRIRKTHGVHDNLSFVVSGITAEAESRIHGSSSQLLGLCSREAEQIGIGKSELEAYIALAQKLIVSPEQIARIILETVETDDDPSDG